MVAIFDDKKTADFYDMNLQYARNHFRGEYILNSKTGEEYINFVTVPDYNANGRTLGIKIDLRDQNKKKPDVPRLSLVTPVYAQEWFDSYDPNISLERQIGSLDNFAIALQKNPEMLGYVAFYVGGKDSVKKIRARINIVRRYLIQTRKIDKKRIVIIYAGKFDTSWMVLQPSPRDKPPPKFGFDSKH